jgi:hypothetical protein
MGWLLGASLSAPLLATAAGADPEPVEEGAALPEGEEIARKVDARAEGESLRERVQMRLTDRRGTQTTREAQIFRRYYGEERRVAVYFDGPARIAGTSFLTYDYPGARDDDQWLYLPASRQVRRISASDRGDAFVGTDFTYNDIKTSGKIGVSDYRFRTLRRDTLDGVPCLVVEAVATSDEVARALGYRKARLWIDPEIWVVRRSEYLNDQDELRKTTDSKEIREVQGIWTVHRFEATSAESGHRTVFEVSDVDYSGARVADELFEQTSMARIPKD